MNDIKLSYQHYVVETTNENYSEYTYKYNFIYLKQLESLTQTYLGNPNKCIIDQERFTFA